MADIKVLNEMTDKEKVEWINRLVGMVATSKLRKTSRIHSPLGAFPPVTLEHYLLYGFQRVFNDGLSQLELPKADDLTEADHKAIMDFANARLADYKAGKVGRTVGGASRWVRQVVLAVLSDKNRKAYEAVEDAKDKKAFLDDLFANADDATQEALQEAADEMEAAHAEEQRSKKERTKAIGQKVGATL